MTSGGMTSSQLLLECSRRPLELILGRWCFKYSNFIKPWVTRVFFVIFFFFSFQVVSDLLKLYCRSATFGRADSFPNLKECFRLSLDIICDMIKKL